MQDNPQTQTNIHKGYHIEDYFNVILPESMVTSSATSPVWNAYLASINVLGTPMLYRKK